MLAFALLLIAATLATSHASDFGHHGHHGHRTHRSYYVCPPNFVRLGNKCYFFSNSTATWQEAYFKCKDLRSNLAIIKSSHQNKILRTALNKESVEPVERWLGGYYDWSQKEWKWAPNGKEMHFQGFSQGNNKDSGMDWQKAIMDPALEYKWNIRSAFEAKHFICQTNLKNVSNKEKKKLRKVYKADADNDLNAIPIPDIYDPSSHLPNDIDPNQPLSDKNDPLHFEADVIGLADFAKRNKEEKLRKKKHRQEMKRKREERKRQREAQRQKRKHNKHVNSTLDDELNPKSTKQKRNWRRNEHHRRNRVDKSTEIPLFPRKIVEDFSDWKLVYNHHEHPASELEKESQKN